MARTNHAYFPRNESTNFDSKHIFRNFLETNHPYLPRNEYRPKRDCVRETSGRFEWSKKEVTWNMHPQLNAYFVQKVAPSSVTARISFQRTVGHEATHVNHNPTIQRHKYCRRLIDLVVEMCRLTT